MWFLSSSLIVLSIAIICVALYFLIRNKSNKFKTIFWYVLIGCFFAIVVVRIFKLDVFDHIVKFNYPQFGSKLRVTMLNILRGVSSLSILLITAQPFIKNKTVRDIILLFCAPVAVLNIIFFKANVECITGVLEAKPFCYQAITLSIQLSIELVIYFYLFFILKHKFNFKENIKLFFFNFFACLFALLLLMMPLHNPQQLFGMLSDINVEFLTFGQHIWIAVTLLFMLLIHLIFRNKNEDIRNSVIVFLALACFYQFNLYYTSIEIPLHNLPLHMCNLATILIPISIITKSKKLFSFNLYVNVVGAFIAILLPDNSSGIISYSFLKFAYEHTLVFAIPLLAVSLRVMPRGSFKQLLNGIALFTVYFVLMIILNTWLYNYDGGVNFFYLNDEFLAQMLPIFRITRQVTFTFTIGSLSFKLYPVFYLLMYFGFIAFMFVAHWIYKEVYKNMDYKENLRKEYMLKKLDRVELLKALDGRPESEPVNYKEGYMLNISHFSKTYDGAKVKAVDDFSLEVKEGEVFGFLGANGAGKSTTIKTIIGILPFEEGKIEIGGFDIKTQSLEAKKLIGYVPDNHSVYESLTGRQYVNYIAELYNVDPKEAEERLVELAEKFNLTKAIDNQIKTYSHGMKQKITIISALIHNPKLWILDEPLTGLDPQSSFEVKEYMREHAQKGNTVFFSSHVIEVVEKICDRVAIINNGVCQGVYDLKQLKKENKSLEQIFLEKTKRK